MFAFGDGEIYSPEPSSEDDESSPLEDDPEDQEAETCLGGLVRLWTDLLWILGLSNKFE